MDDLAQLHELPLHRDRPLERGRLRVGEDRVLELVELGQLRQEAVDELVDHEVEDAEALLVALRAPVRLVAELREDRAFTLVHRDQPVRRVEAVHLDRRKPGPAGGVGDRTEDDEEGEVVEVLDLRTLPELARVLERERVEVEGVVQ